MDEFVLGGMSAIAAISCMHPVDVVKTRLQFQGERGAIGSTGGKQYRGVFSSLLSIGRHEGLQGLYRGIIPAYGLQFSVTATRFGVYGATKRYFGDDKPSNVRNFILAGVSGGLGALAGNPFFALKTRAQAYSSSKELAVGTQHQPKGSLLEEFASIYKSEGIRGYWRGAEAFVPRVVAYGAAQLSTYDATKTFLLDKHVFKEGISLHFAASFVAATAAVIAIQPFDFVAARLMNQAVDARTGKGVLYSGFFDCMVKSVESEGPGALFKGMWANCVRMGPYTVLVLVFMEQFRMIAKKIRAE